MNRPLRGLAAMGSRTQVNLFMSISDLGNLGTYFLHVIEQRQQKSEHDLISKINLMQA